MEIRIHYEICHKHSYVHNFSNSDLHIVNIHLLERNYTFLIQAYQIECYVTRIWIRTRNIYNLRGSLFFFTFEKQALHNILCTL